MFNQLRWRAFFLENFGSLFCNNFDTDDLDHTSVCVSKGFGCGVSQGFEKDLDCGVL